MYLTLTRNVKFHCPAGFDKNIFACACRMIQDKVNSARQAGVTDIKSVNAVKKDNFMCVFNFPEDVYDSAWAQVTGKDTWFIREHLRLTTKGLHTRKLFERWQ